MDGMTDRYFDMERRNWLICFTTSRDRSDLNRKPLFHHNRDVGLLWKV